MDDRNDTSNETGASIRYDVSGPGKKPNRAVMALTTDRWGTSTPLGWPVEPLV